DSSFPLPLMTANGVLFFSAKVPGLGRELWRTNGTDAGTWLVADVEPGATEAFPGSVGTLGSSVVFSAPDARHRVAAPDSELWIVENAATCGNGVVDPGEECDDANGGNTDACTTTCHFNVCGDGFVRAGVEDCDDGNAADGDCCSSTCTFEGAGAPCPDDGDPCSGDTCDGSGRCTHATPTGAGVTCRPAAGPCDVPETCDGVHPTCPIDGFDVGSSCRHENPPCGDDLCNGTSAECPLTSVLFICQPSTTTTTTLPPLHCAGVPVAPTGCHDPIAPVKNSLAVKNQAEDRKDSIG